MLSKPAQELSHSLCPSDAVSFPFGDARVVARAQINTVYVLNESASLVWDAVAAGASEAEAAQSLARHYDISEDLASQDVHSVIANWRSAGLIGPRAVESEIRGPWVRSIKEISIDAGAIQFEEEHSYAFLDLRFRLRFQTADLARAIHPRFANLEAARAAVRAATVREWSEHLGPLPDGRGTCAWMAPESVFRIIVAGESGGELRLDGAGADYILDRPDGVATTHLYPAGLAYELFFEIMNLAHSDLEPMACLHSSLIGWRDGAIALVANNGSGKSTLAAALASSGLPALADDRVFMDSVTGRPVASPTAIGLKRGSWLPLLSRYPDILQLPLIRNQGDARHEAEIRYLLPPPPTHRLLPPIQHVFFPCYSSAAVTAAIPLTPVQALERITAAEGWISSDPEKLASFLRWLESVPCYDLPFSSLDAAIEEITKSLAI